ncbi:MAG: D-alanyl-D-alanine carboxypeptidase family protein [Clostridia bacterium]|nr:D-alanyl-D-alanine carboxypeptidase family protein [Clostridia bacterium]
MKIIMLLLLVFFATPTVSYGLEISAKSACLIVAESGEIVYAKEPDMRLPMASTTKMMTALVAAESGCWEDVATVSVNAQNQEGSSIYLQENDRVKLSDLVSGMMLNSGNDAAVATAEHISGSSENFAKLMTERARKIGAVNTSFENPSGLDNENHYSTAYDLALIGSEVVKNKCLSPIIQSKEMKITNQDGDVTYLRNHNKLLWSYEGMIGVKTGFTKKSGRCLVTAAKRDGITLVAVTLCDPCDWKDHKEMLDYGFERCQNRVEIKEGAVLKEVSVGNELLKIVAEESLATVDVIDIKEERELRVSIIREIEAPINKGEKVGEAKMYQNGRLIGEINLVAERDIFEIEKEKEGFFHTIKELLGI